MTFSKAMKKILFLLVQSFCVFIFCAGQSFAQQSTVDSLFNVLKTPNDDTSKVRTLNLLSGELINIGDFDRALSTANSAIALIQNQNNSDKAAVLWDKRATSGIYNMIGIIYWYKGDYNKALEFYYKALKIREALNDKKGMAASYNNIGNIHHGNGEFDKALELYFKGLRIFEEMDDKQRMTYSYNNIGIIYSYKGEIDKALEFYFKALKIREELGDKKGMSDSYHSIGIVYDRSDDNEKSLVFLSKSLKLRIELDDKQGVATSYISIGNVYMKQKKFVEGKQQLLNSLTIAKKIGYKEGIKEAYSSLSACDSSLGNFRSAYEYHKLYSFYKDSIFNAESNKSMAEMQTKYDSEKKDKELIQKDAELTKQNVESEKRVTERNAFIVGFLLMLALVFFIFRSYRQKQVANVEISKQKAIVDAKQKEILDSFHYAERIQKSLLTSERYIEKNMSRLKNKK